MCRAKNGKATAIGKPDEKHLEKHPNLGHADGEMSLAVKNEMKVIGRQGSPKGGLEAVDQLQRMANVLRQGRPFIPKGVWRFKTFEEANAWTLRMMTRR